MIEQDFRPKRLINARARSWTSIVWHAAPLYQGASPLKEYWTRSTYVLQIRRHQSRRQPQAEHRGFPGLNKRAGGIDRAGSETRRRTWAALCPWRAGSAGMHGIHSQLRAPEPCAGMMTRLGATFPSRATTRMPAAACWRRRPNSPGRLGGRHDQRGRRRCGHPTMTPITRWVVS